MTDYSVGRLGTGGTDFKVLRIAADALSLLRCRPILLLPGVVFVLLQLERVGALDVLTYLGSKGVASTLLSLAVGTAALALVTGLINVIAARTELRMTLYVNEVLDGALLRWLPALILVLVLEMAILALPDLPMWLFMNCWAVGEMSTPSGPFVEICNSPPGKILLSLAALTPILFLLPLFLTVRWLLVPSAVVLGGAGVLKAFKMSWGMTRGHWWALFSLLIPLPVPLMVLGFAARFISMPLQSFVDWLVFSWLSIVLTLAYIRLGGRMRLLPDAANTAE